MTVKELIERLSALPQDAIVHVAEGYTRVYDSGTRFVDCGDEHINVIDYKDGGVVYVELGEV